MRIDQINARLFCLTLHAQLISQGKNLDYLGMVAGIIDDMGLVEQVNQLMGTKLANS